MEVEPVFCTSCGEMLVIPLSQVGRSIACPSCHASYVVEEEFEEGSEWDPAGDAEEAKRIFGPTATGPLSSPPEADTEKKPTEEIQPVRRGSPTVVVLLVLMALGTAGLGYALWVQIEKTREMATRLGAQERELTRVAGALGGLGDLPANAVEFQTQLDEMDESISRMAAGWRQLGATTLQTDYAMRYAQRVMVKHENELGRSALKLQLVERELSDKSRHAKEAFELTVKKRKAAEDAAKPIRARIRDLEQKKEQLFARYRAVSMVRRPEGVVSTRRAATMQKEWEARSAPVLTQIQSEIDSVRNSIDDEEARIDALFE